MDEADRLLGNAYHSWIKGLVQGVQSTASRSDRATRQEGGGVGISQRGGMNTGQGHASASESESQKQEDLFLAQNTPPTLQRLLFSATLTDNPRKLAMLNIRNPQVIKARAADGALVEGEEGETEEAAVPPGGFILPSTLTESMIVVDTARRPLLLATALVEALGKTDKLGLKEPSKKVSARHTGHVICTAQRDMVLIFASSVETAHRLCRLLQLMNGQSLDNLLAEDKDNTEVGTEAGKSKGEEEGEEEKRGWLFGGRVAEMNRNIRPAERERILEQAAQGNIAVLVSSDAMSRGIDLPNIKLVVNYDPPKYARSYVHRVGRTARANREGHSLTLLKSGQAGAFRKMRVQIGGAAAAASDKKEEDVINKCKPSKELEALVAPRMDQALRVLPRALGMATGNGSTNVDIGE